MLVKVTTERGTTSANANMEQSSQENRLEFVFLTDSIKLYSFVDFTGHIMTSHLLSASFPLS